MLYESIHRMLSLSIFPRIFLSVEDTREPDQGNRPTKYNKKLIGEKGMQVEEKG